MLGLLKVPSNISYSNQPRVVHCFAFPSMGSSGGEVVKAGYWFCKSGFKVEGIQPQHFTHLYAAFADVDPDSYEVIFPTEYQQQFETFTKTVKQNFPSGDVKTLLSIGGTEDSTTPSNIASVARDSKNRTIFIKSSIEVARKFDFDGLDLCWLKPSGADEMTFLRSLLNEWKAEVEVDAKKRNKDPLLLTAVVFFSPIIPGADGKNFNYPCRDMSDKLDWINVMAFDFYTPAKSPTETGPAAAWSNPTHPNRCGSAGIGEWINKNVSTNKIVLGLPFYGYQWRLRMSAEHGIFAPADAANTPPLNFKQIRGTFNNAPKQFEENYVTDYCYSARTWIGYDDTKSISTKVTNARMENELRGYFAWHVGADDDSWTLSKTAFLAWDAANQ